MLAVHLYYEFQKSKGSPTFINNISRRDLNAFLVADNILNNRSDLATLLTWYYMTNKVVTPDKGVDQASFYHDKYSGNVGDPNNRDGNKRWIKNAWKHPHGPVDYAAAITGTILFSLVTWVNDARYVKHSRYDRTAPSQWHGTGQKFSFSGSY